MLKVLLAGLSLSAAALAQLPPLIPPAANLPTPEKNVLGKILFWDEQLSSDDSVACGTCHQPAFGGSDPRSAFARHPGTDGVFGTDDDPRGSPGVTRQASGGAFTNDATFGLGTQVTRRLANTTLGAAYHRRLFWDMRASDEFVDPESGAVLIPWFGALETQAVGPIMNPVEMSREGRTWLDVRNKLAAAEPLRLASNLPSDVQAALQQNPTYPMLFTAAFGDPAITAARIAFAIASYERTLLPDDTPWDRYMQGQPAAMTPTEEQGWLLFQSSGRCIACHWAPLFTDDEAHVLGLRYPTDDPGIDLSLGIAADPGSFKTPSLRNAGLRPRLFHNGQSPALGDPAQVTDLASSLNVYLKGGGIDSHHLDGFLLPLQALGVPVGDVQLMQEFVRTALTDQRAALRQPPFDHPDLRSVVVPPPRVFGQGRAGAIEPFLIDTVPAYPGNADWKLGLAASSGPTLGFLAIGLQSHEPPMSVWGLPWNVQPVIGLPLWLSASNGGPGLATWHAQLPDLPWLAQVPFYFQLLAFDPHAPWGVAASKGTEIFVR